MGRSWSTTREQKSPTQTIQFSKLLVLTLSPDNSLVKSSHGHRVDLHFQSLQRYSNARGDFFYPSGVFFFQAPILKPNSS